MDGSLTDTYVAALQHEIANIPEDSVKIGVVRRATPWFHAQVDRNVPALGPPASLLADVKERHEALADDGMNDAAAHNAAMDAVGYDDRYLEYLAESSDAQAAIDDVRARVTADEDVVLVCYENTDEKRCHRTLLRDRILAGIDG